MIIADLLGWWYLRGWGWLLHQIFSAELGKVLHFFSITDLLKTLFAPFRQDSLQTKNAPIGIKLQVLGGNLISRFFGFIIRAGLIAMGLVTAAATVIGGIGVIVLWPILPLVPILAFALMILGVKL